MERIVCTLCGMSDFKLLFRINDFDILKCSQCGLVFTASNHKTTDVTGIYSMYRSDSEKEEQQKHGARLAYNFLRKTQKLGFKRLEKILDVGCGLGFFLKAMEPFVKEGLGEEISDYQISFAKDKLGVNVLKGKLNDLGLPREHFDAITMWDVIEHLPFPVDYLNECHRLLRKGGLIVISTPNFNSLTRRIVGKKWLVFNPPEHIFYFTPKTLERMLKIAGFIPLRISTKGLDIHNISQYFEITPINRQKVWSARKETYNHLKKYNVILKSVNRKIIDPILQLLHIGNNITVYAIKMGDNNRKKPKKFRCK